MTETSGPEGDRPLPSPKPRSSRTIASVALAAFILLFAVSVAMGRSTPSSSQSVVQAWVVQMAAEVPGRVSRVADNAPVRTGEKQTGQELGPAGDRNPQIREALASLERARLDVTRTTVNAPADGGWVCAAAPRPMSSSILAATLS